MIVSHRAGVVCALLISAFCAATAQGQHVDFKELARLGLTYTNERTRVPWSIHCLRIDRSRPELALVASKARGRVIGLERLSLQMNAVPPEAGEPLAAVNGDFYKTESSPYAGDPRGLTIVRGEVISAPTANPCFWIATNGEPVIAQVDSHFRVTWPGGAQTPFGLNEERASDAAVLYSPTLGRSTMTRGALGRELVLEREKDGAPWLPLEIGKHYKARIREVRETNNAVLAKDILVLSLGPRLLAQLPKVSVGEVIELSLATIPNLAGVQTAIGGGPKLVQDGKPTPPERPETLSRASYSVRAMFDRHPRTAVGFNDSHIFLVEVDGRQEHLSVGMTLEELAKYLAKIGCTEAMNLDGGASSQMIVGSKVVNSPSAGRERNTATGLVVVRKPSR